MNAGEMINRCFRHQHPEAYDLPCVDEADVPARFRYGNGQDASASTNTPPLDLPPMGNGETL
jgi:hypothetical protein